MSARVLITGAGSFTGPYVAAALERRGYEVFGLTRGMAQRPREVSADLMDREALRRVVSAVRPAYVVHLAAITFVPYEDASAIYRVNLLGTLNLIEALALLQPDIRKLLLASSANVYGRPAVSPVSESACAAPISHYAVSKYAMELMARRWFDRIPIVIVRPFNYTGVGQDPKYVVPKLVRHFARRTGELELGDTTVVREFMDVRDVAEAYSSLIDAPVDSECLNLCSGTGYRLEDVLSRLRNLTGFRPVVRSSEALLRKNDIAELVGAPAKLRSFCPDVSFRPLDETLAWMLEACS